MSKITTVIVLLGFVVKSFCTSVLLFDSQDSGFLKSCDRCINEYETEHLTALYSGLLGLRPPYQVSGTSFLQVLERLQHPPLTSYPKATLFVNLLGSKRGTGLGELLSSTVRGAAGQVSLQGGDRQVAELVDDLAAANPSVLVYPLHLAGLEDCSEEACLDKGYMRIAQLTGAHFDQEGPEGPHLTFSSGVVINCQSAEGQLVREVAQLLAVVDGVVEQLKQRVTPQEDLEVYTLRLGGFKTLVDEQLQDGMELMGAVLQHVVTELDTVYMGQVTCQVALMDGTESLIADQLSPQHQRRLHLAGGEGSVVGEETAADAHAFSRRAAAVCSFLGLLYFAFAAVYCMCTMKFRQDTLLYSRAKVD